MWPRCALSSPHSRPPSRTGCGTTYSVVSSSYHVMAGRRWGPEELLCVSAMMGEPAHAEPVFSSRIIPCEASVHPCHLPCPPECPPVVPMGSAQLAASTALRFLNVLLVVLFSVVPRLGGKDGHPILADCSVPRSETRWACQRNVWDLGQGSEFSVEEPYVLSPPCWRPCPAPACGSRLRTCTGPLPCETRLRARPAA